ncbi:helix-turn-helix domain-containing protein [Clostridioides difficile]
MQSAPVLENIVEDTDEVILKSYQDAKVIVENDSNISSNDKNKSIVSILNESGIFKIKDSVVKVADLMGLSKNTIYMHLRNLNKN